MYNMLWVIRDSLRPIGFMPFITSTTEVNRGQRTSSLNNNEHNHAVSTYNNTITA